jgi:hypothetical protein
MPELPKNPNSKPQNQAITRSERKEVAAFRMPKMPRTAKSKPEN